MKLADIGRMAYSDVMATRGRAAISATGIALGIMVLAVIAGLGLGTREVVLNKVVGRLPVDIIEVVPRTVSLGLFEVNTGFFGGTPLDQNTLARLAAMPGVVAAYPKLEVRLPMGARGGTQIFGRSLYTDLFMNGLPVELLAPELGDAFHDTRDFVPVVISDQLIDIYNASVAPSLGTPRLTSKTLNGFQFDIVFGRSLMLGSRGARRTGQEPAQIVGASRYAMRLGVTVPIETARRLVATYGDPEEDERYASILLRVDSPTAVPAVTAAVQAAGLAVDETAKRTSDIITGATLLASLVGLLVLMLAALNIAHTFVASLTERRRELAILRAVGARRLDLVLLVLAQAAIIGVAGGVLGLLLGRAGAWLLNWGAQVVLGDLPFTPTVLLPPWLAAVSLGAAVVASLLGALWPAIRASRAPLARVLGEV